MGDNWKIVQKSFRTKNIQKPIVVKQVVRGKFQDNLEILQWFKHFFEYYYSGSPYDAYKARWKKEDPKGRGAYSLYWDEASRQLVDDPTGGDVGSYTESKKSSKKKVAKKKVKKGGKSDLSKEIHQLTMTVEAVEKERNFYFGKLREIEILCQDIETNPDIDNTKKLTGAVLDIMYKTDEDGEMVAPDT